MWHLHKKPNKRPLPLFFASCFHLNSPMTGFDGGLKRGVPLWWLWDEGWVSLNVLCSPPPSHTLQPRSPPPFLWMYSALHNHRNPSAQIYTAISLNVLCSPPPSHTLQPRSPPPAPPTSQKCYLSHTVLYFMGEQQVFSEIWLLFVLLVGKRSSTKRVRFTLHSVKVAHATISGHLYTLSCTQVQCYTPLQQLHSAFRDCSHGVFVHVMKSTIAESNPDPELLTQQTFCFCPKHCG